MYILRDTSGAEKLGMTAEEITTALTGYDTALANTIRTNFSNSGLEITDETLEEICQARRDALSKMVADFTLTSTEANTAVVTLATSYFNETELDENAAYSAREEADAKGFTDYDEYLKYIMETYTKNLIAGYQSVTPSEERKEIVVKCTIVDGTWLPMDMASFGGELGRAVSGQP